MVAASRPPPHAPPPHAPPTNAAVADLEAQLKVARLEAQLTAAKKADEAAQSAPNPPYASNPSYASNPPYQPSAPLPGVPAGEPSVRAARKLSTKRPLAGGEGADARATKQHTVDLT